MKGINPDVTILEAIIEQKSLSEKIFYIVSVVA
jgi:hypothetical protein